MHFSMYINTNVYTSKLDIIHMAKASVHETRLEHTHTNRKLKICNRHGHPVIKFLRRPEMLVFRILHGFQLLCRVYPMIVCTFDMNENHKLHSSLKALHISPVHRLPALYFSSSIMCLFCICHSVHAHSVSTTITRLIGRGKGIQIT